MFAKKKMRIMCILSAVMLIMSGCGKVESITVNDPVDVKLPDTDYGVKNVDFYIDKSASMAGYLGLTSGDEAVVSRYKNQVGQTAFTRSLIDAVYATHAGWPEAAHEYFEFSDTVNPINETVFTVDTQNPDFFESRVSSISKAIESFKKDSLSVLVTDLCENDSMINNIAQSINKKVFKSGNVVSVICLKSEFAGYVYEVSESGDDFPYGLNYGADGKIKMRNFYMIAAGKYAAINKFVNELHKATDKEKIGFQHEIVRRMPLVDFVRAEESSGGERNCKIDVIEKGKKTIFTRKSALKLKGDGKDNAFVIDVKKKGGKDRELVMTFDLQTTFNISDMVKQGVFDIDPGTKHFTVGPDGKPYELELSDVVPAYFTEKNAEITEDGKYRVNVKFNNNIRYDKPVWLEIKHQIYPDYGTLPKWIEDETLNVTDLNKWRNDPASFDGEKTRYLDRFFTILYSMTDDKEGYPVARFNLVFNFID